MRLSFFLLALIGFGSCAEPAAVSISAQDRRAVTEAVLQHVLADRPERPLFRRRVDMSFLSDAESWQDRPELKPGSADSFVVANAPGTMHEEWLGSFGVGLIAEADYQAHFSKVSHGGLAGLEAGWESVLRGPPECTVVMTLSAPGFSADGDQALMSVGASSGVLCGSGGLYLLERQSGAWVVATGLMYWES